MTSHHNSETKEFKLGSKRKNSDKTPIIIQPSVNMSVHRTWQAEKKDLANPKNKINKKKTKHL